MEKTGTEDDRALRVEGEVRQIISYDTERLHCVKGEILFKTTVNISIEKWNDVKYIQKYKWISV